MKIKFLFILLLFIPVFFTSCDEESAQESCEELGCQWYKPIGSNEWQCSC